MKTKHIISIGIMVCVLSWILLKPNTETKRDPVNRQPTSEALEDGQPTPKFSVKKDITPVSVSPETLAERGRERVAELNEALGVADYPYAKEIQEAMNSPAFVEFQKQPFTIKRWFDFLESQGVKSYRNMYTEIWQRLYPESDLLEYTEVVKAHLVEEILSTELVGLPGSIEREIQIMTIYDEKILQQNEQNSTWHNATFLVHEDPNAWVKWAVSIAENASNLTPSATETVDSGRHPDESTAPTTQDVAEKMMIDNADSTGHPEGAEKRTLLEIFNPSSEYREDIESKLITEPRTPSLESTFQQLLENEHFSPQRLNTAMQTLSQYGPEDGLRRLKESDPEVATQMEKFIQSNTGTD